MIKLDKVSKVFPTGVSGLSDVSVDIGKGEFAFITGTTGSGKTTLLKVIIREILPTEGDVMVADVDVVNLPKKNIPHFRKKIGIIFQDLKLLADRTILENVLLPLEIAGVATQEAIAKAEELLEDVGLTEHKEKFPVQLSGGELQRVAIARALTLGPEIIIADEPTGNLDNDTAMAIVDLLHAINKKGTTIVMVTHNTGIVEKYPENRVVILEKGKITKDTKAHKTKLAEVKTDSTAEVVSASSDDDEKPVVVEKKHEKTHSHKEKTTEEPVADVFSGSIEEKIETKKGKNK